MTGAHQSSGRKRPVKRGPQIVQIIGASTSFNASLGVTVTWRPGDIVYVFCWGRSNSVFSAPTNVGEWVRVLENSAVGGTTLHAISRAVAVTTSGGSRINVTRSGNSVGWSMLAVIVRGADTSVPEDFVGILRPAGFGGSAVVTVPPLSATKENCLQMALVAADSGTFKYEQSLQLVHNNIGICELGASLSSPESKVRGTATGGTVNWAVPLMLLRPAA